MNWDYKELWRQRGNDSLVEVSHHQEIARDGDGPNRWCVYAYIYPDHPRFSLFVEGGGMFQAAAQDLPMHGGSICRASLVEPLRHGGETITAWEVGADYSHDHDQEYTHFNTKDEASTVFFDAETLISFLNAEAKA